MQWIFSFTVDDGLGEANPTYYFNCRHTTRKVTKKGNRGGNLKINESYFVFDAVGYTNGEGIDYALKTKVISKQTAKEMRDNLGYYQVTNLEKFSIGSYEFNCPRLWKDRIQGHLSEKTIEIFLKSNEDEDF